MDHPVCTKRERKSLEESLRTAQRIQVRGGRDEMPAIRIGLEPTGRPTAPHKAKRRHQWLTDEYEQALARRIERVDLEEAFTRAAEGTQESGDTGDSSDGPHPRSESRTERIHRQPSHRRTRGRDKDRER